MIFVSWDWGMVSDVSRRQQGYSTYKVKVQRLIKRECLRIGVKRRINLSGGLSDEMVFESCLDLFNVARTNRTASRALESVVASEVDVHAVLIAFPLLVIEQAAESRITQGDSLIGTERLGVVAVLCSPVEERAGARVQAFSRIGKIDFVPSSGSVGSTFVGISVRVGAVVVTRECVVPSALSIFNGKDQSSVFSPPEAKKTSQEVLCRLCHPVLSSGSSNDLAAIIGIEMAVHVLMECAGVEELLLSHGHQDLIAEKVLPAVQEAQFSRECDIAKSAIGIVLNLLGQELSTSSSGRIPCAVTAQHVDLYNAGIFWQSILVHTKADGIREVVRELAVKLEDVPVICVALNWDLSLQRSIWNIRGTREWRRIHLSEERSRTSRSRSSKNLRFRLVVVWQAGATARRLLDQPSIREATDGRGHDVASVQHDELHNNDHEK